MLETYGIHQPSLVERALLRRLGYAGIYFLNWDCDDPQTDPIKIGIADDPFSRFANFQCGNWRRLVVHEILWVRSKPHMSEFRSIRNSDGLEVGKAYDRYGEGYIPIRDIERSAHGGLKKAGWHISGEWFTGGIDALVPYVKTGITEAFKHDYLAHRSMLRKLKAWKIEAQAA